MLKIPIKASQISNLTDARYFAAWGVEWMGFSLDLLPAAEIKMLKEWIEGPRMVGEFGLHPPGDILQMAELLQLDALQLSHFTPGKDLSALSKYPLIKEVVVDDLQALGQLEFTLKQATNVVQHFLLDFKKANLSWSRLSTKDIQQLRSIATQYPIILAIPFEAQQLPAIINSLPIKGLDLAGGEEEKIGFKSFDELDEIFELLEE